MRFRSHRLIPALLFAVLILAFLLARSESIQAKLNLRDFGEYWAGGRLLLLHQDPYSPTQYLREHGITVSKALTVRMPPWSLPILLPLAVLPPFGSWILWMAMAVAALFVSVNLCWQMIGKDLPPRARVFAYLFPPILACLAAAQIGLLLLVGIVLFLRYQSERPVLAGAALLLPFSKPHLLGVFWICLLLWCVTRRRWSVLKGFAATLLAATAVALALDPAVFSQYFALLQRASIDREFIPTIPGVGRALFFKATFWAQFVPAWIALFWGVFYFARNRRQWNWLVHGCTAIVVSVLTTPYGWLTDETVVLPAMLIAAVWILRSPASRGWKRLLAVSTFAAMNGLMLLMILVQVPMPSGLYFWSSLVWMGWYGVGLRFRSDRVVLWHNLPAS